MSDYLKKRQHDAMFGKPEPEERFSAIRKVGAKRKSENEIYKDRREVFLRKHKGCKANLRGCTKKANEIHHKKGRVGKNFLDEKTWLPVCRKCHTHLELNPHMAKGLGLSESRLNKTN